MTKNSLAWRKISHALLLSVPWNATLIRLRLSNYQIPRIRILNRVDAFRGIAPYKWHSLRRFRLFIVLRKARNEFRRSCVHPRVLCAFATRFRITGREKKELVNNDTLSTIRAKEWECLIRHDAWFVQSSFVDRSRRSRKLYE